MLDLSTISFKVDTSELDRAGKAIGELVTNVGKLDKATRDAAQTEAVLAKAAKLNADANLQNAKAQDVRLKSTITADKADQQATAAIEKKTKATEKATESSAKNVGVLQRQKDILEFQTQGFSKGQSSILSYAKAAGLAADDIGELGKVLETQRKLMGGDPFDKSLSGLKSLRNQYTELKESLRQYAKDSNLTAKQTRELARDKERLIEKMKVEGASFSEIRQAVRAHNAEYVNLATSYNKMISAEDAVIKSRKDAVNATNYLTQADQRMAAALNTSNAAIDKAGTDSLVKYETALRKSGISQDVATLKLAKYKAQLEQVQIQEQKRSEQHLTRALAPQATDVVVSLWSGQNPLTVLLQQGGQITDLFMQSGIAAEKFGEVVKSSMKSMLPSILTVVKGVGGLLVDGLTSAGNAVLGFVGKVTGMSGALDGANKKLMDMGWTIAAAGVRGLGILMTTVFAAGAGAVVAGLVAIGVALKQVISENDKMAVSLGLTGAAMGLTFATATDLSKSMQGIGVSTSDAMKVLSEMAKQGKLTSEDVMLVTKAAVDMNTYAGVAIEDTVKQFVKMKEKPVEAMLELAKATGLVAPEVVKAVIELEDQGKTAEATSKAIEELARVNDEQVARMKESYNGFSLFMIDLGKGISKFFSDAFKDLFYAASPTEQLKTQLKAVDETLKNWGTMNTDAAGAIQMLIPGEKERVQLQRTQLLNQIALLDQEKQQYEVSQKEKQDKIAMLGLEKSISDELAKRDLKRSKKKDNLQDFTANFIEEKAKDAAKSKNLDLETIKNNYALMESYKKLAQVEWESAQKKPKKDPQVNYLATLMREATNATITADGAVQELTKSQIKLQEVQADPRYQALAEEDKKRVAAIYEKAVVTEKATAAQDLANKLLGKADMLGSTYYETIKKIDAYQQQGTYSAEYAERLRKAAFDQTELAKTRLKIEEDSYNFVEKYRDENEKALNSTVLENAKLDDRLALLGLTSEQQKYLRIEQERRNKLLAIDLKLQTQIQEVWDKWGSGGFGQDGATKAKAVIVELEKAAAEERKNINKEVAVQYREDFQREFIDPIRNGLTDSIVTALFEGGKSGSKKFRDLVVAQLRKPVTMVVNAVVNTVLGSVVGALGFGGGGNSGGGSGLPGAANAASSAYNLINGGFNVASQAGTWLSGKGTELALQYMGESAGTLLNNFALGMSSTSSMSAAAAALQGTGAEIAGLAVGSLMNGFAGYGISSLLSGGYSAGGWVNTVAGIASAIPGIGPIAGVIGGAVNRLFGRKLKDAGIEGTFGGETGFEGNSFEYYKGGLFRSNKTKRSPLDEETRSALADNFNAMRVATAAMADVLGLGTDAISNFTASVKISLKGLSAEDAQKKIQKEFDKIAESLARQTLGTDAFSRAGESSVQTLTRLAGSLSSVNTVFDTLGYTLYDASLVGGDMASKLVDLFGNLETFTASASSYYQNFYSAEEQRANVQKQLAKSFKELGLSMIDIDATDARQQFRDLVEAQDLTTESGRRTWAALMGVSGAFASVTMEVTGSIITVADALNALRNETRSVEDIAQNILSLEQALFEAQNSGNIEVLRNNILQGLTEQERVLQRQLWAIEDTRTAQERLVSAYKGQVTALDSSINRLRTYSDSLKNFKDSLTLGELSPLTPSEQYAEAKRQYESNLALAMVGDVGAQNALQGSITAFLQASRTYNASSSQYTSDFNTAQAGLDFIASITQDQANNEQILRDAAVSQLELLGSIDESVTAVGELISSGLIELSNAILTGLSLGVTPDQGVLDAVNNGLGGGQSSYYNSLHTTTQSQSNQPIAIIPVNQASAMQSDSQGLVSLNSQLVEEVRNLTAQVILLRSERQQDTRDQTQILATATTEAGTAVTEAINKSNYAQQVRTGATLN